MGQAGRIPLFWCSANALHIELSVAAFRANAESLVRTLVNSPPVTSTARISGVVGRVLCPVEFRFGDRPAAHPVTEQRQGNNQYGCSPHFMISPAHAGHVATNPARGPELRSIVDTSKYQCFRASTEAFDQSRVQCDRRGKMERERALCRGASPDPARARWAHDSGLPIMIGTDV